MASNDDETPGFWETYWQLVDAIPGQDTHDLPVVLAIVLQPLIILFVALPVWVYRKLFGG
jgi:hypothetical protein